MKLPAGISTMPSRAGLRVAEAAGPERADAVDSVIGRILACSTSSTAFGTDGSAKQLHPSGPTPKVTPSMAMVPSTSRTTAVISDSE